MDKSSSATAVDQTCPMPNAGANSNQKAHVRDRQPHTLSFVPCQHSTAQRSAVQHQPTWPCRDRRQKQGRLSSSSAYHASSSLQPATHCRTSKILGATDDGGGDGGGGHHERGGNGDSIKKNSNANDDDTTMITTAAGASASASAAVLVVIILPSLGCGESKRARERVDKSCSWLAM